MNIELSIAGDVLPSRYDVGQEVLFHPAIENLSIDEANVLALRAKIVGVHFTEWKVTYDLALLTPNADGTVEYYDALPARCVDSIMVKSAADVEAQDPTRPSAAAFLSGTELDPMLVHFTALSSAVEALATALDTQVATASAADHEQAAYAAFAAAIEACPEQSE